jgi:hypothetical protein
VQQGAGISSAKWLKLNSGMSDTTIRLSGNAFFFMVLSLAPAAQPGSVSAAIIIAPRVQTLRLDV